jgi:hypothetical protein
MRASSRITRTILGLLIAVPLSAAIGQAEELARPLAIGSLTSGDPATGGIEVLHRRPIFKVRGHRQGLYPGRRATVRIRVKNPNAFPILLKKVKAKVHSPQPGCSSRRVRTKPWKGSRRISPHGRIYLHLRVRMVRGAPDACQGVRFQLRYGGRAVRT